MAEIKRLINELICGEDGRAESAALHLIESGESALIRLLDMVDDQNPEVRWWALRTISGFDNPQVTDVLRKALHDPILEVKMCAVMGLRYHPSETAVDDLIILLDSHDRLLSRLAGDALIQIGPPAVPALINKIEIVDHHTRLEAARALAIIRDDRAIPIFFRIVKEGDSALMEHWADVGLQNLGIGMALFFKPE